MVCCISKVTKFNIERSCLQTQKHTVNDIHSVALFSRLGGNRRYIVRRRRLNAICDVMRVDTNVIYIEPTYPFSPVCLWVVCTGNTAGRSRKDTVEGELQ